MQTQKYYIIENYMGEMNYWQGEGDISQRLLTPKHATRYTEAQVKRFKRTHKGLNLHQRKVGSKR